MRVANAALLVDIPPQVCQELVLGVAHLVVGGQVRAPHEGAKVAPHALVEDLPERIHAN